jgi:hypothetical protein
MHVVTLAGGPICHKSSIQSIMAMSTTKGENLVVEQGGVHRSMLFDNQSVMFLLLQIIKFIMPRSSIY